jgi:perosamine synthetase
MIRCQLPAYSPVSLRAVRRAALHAYDTDPAGPLRDLLAARYQASSVLLCGSGTQALQLALRLAFDMRPGTAVALPAYGCFDLVSAAVGAGVPVMLYDLDPTDLGPDMSSFDAVLGAGASVAVIAPLYGMPVDWEAVAASAQRHGTLLIEDAAQGHGARLHGHSVGSLGEISVLSFGRGKGWTGGHGGALLLRGASSSHVPELLGAPALSGPTTAVAAVVTSALARPSLYGLPRSLPFLGLGTTRYHDPQEPRAMSRFSAALALQTIIASDREQAVRERAAHYYRTLLTDDPGVSQVRVVPGAVPGYLRYPVLLNDRSRVPSDATRFGIAPGYPRCLRDLEPLQRLLRNPAAQAEGARTLVSRLMTLPTHSLTSPRDRRSVVSCIAAPRSTRPYSFANQP